MMDRGWTGYIVGFNNNQATLPNVSIEHMYYVTSNGHPLPGSIFILFYYILYKILKIIFTKFLIKFTILFKLLD